MKATLPMQNIAISAESTGGNRARVKKPNTAISSMPSEVTHSNNHSTAHRTSRQHDGATQRT